MKVNIFTMIISIIISVSFITQDNISNKPYPKKKVKKYIC